MNERNSVLIMKTQSMKAWFATASVLVLSLGASAWAEEGGEVKAAGENLKGQHEQVVQDRQELMAEKAKLEELRKTRNEKKDALRQAVQENGGNSEEAKAARADLRESQAAVRQGRESVREKRKDLHDSRKDQHAARKEMRAARQSKREGRGK